MKRRSGNEGMAHGFRGSAICFTKCKLPPNSNNFFILIYANVFINTAYKYSITVYTEGALNHFLPRSAVVICGCGAA